MVSSLNGTNDLHDLAEKIVRERLLSIPEELKKYVPSILFKKYLKFYSHITSQYFVFICTTDYKLKDFEITKKELGYPFPHLITTLKTNRCMFRVDKARNFVIAKMTLNVGKGYSFCLGKDATLLIYDICQKALDKKNVPLQYDIDLAFIVSFGDEIKYDNLLDFFESLIAYAFKTWKSGYESKKPA